jgi:hypothetical protein
MAMSESRRKKLQMLLRSVAKGGLTTGDALQVRSAGVAVPARREPLALAEACPGGEQTVALAAGRASCWLVRRELVEVAPTGCDGARQLGPVLRGARQKFDELAASAALCHAAAARCEDLLFMDTETCGLAGASIFLVGTMFYRDGEPVFEQYLARDYAEEPAILAAFAAKLAGASVLVTFNGKAFDMNMIRDRCAFHRVILPGVEPPHLDLLHESRRRWRGQVPNCRLQTLESLLCGRQRVGDIPGAEIPQAYHDFVRTADARQMRDILHHNLLDLLTLAELLCAILTGCDRLG